MCNFDGNDNIQAKKCVTLPNVMDTVKENVTQIVIVNWSHQPETLYAKTIVGTIEKLYNNADIAVIVDNSNTGTEENAPVSHAEAQYDDIAQVVQVETQRTDSSWYDSRCKMGIPGQVALNDPAQNPHLGNECTQ